MRNLTASITVAALLASLHGALAAADAVPPQWQVLAPTLFEHLVPSEKGFPGPTTMCMTQDADGFLWFGTQTGLGRWDGYRMRNFFARADDPQSVPADFIQTLHVDRQGRLWVGTPTDGLAVYDKQTERFIRFPVGPDGLSSPAISAIASDDTGVWVGSAGGLDYIDTAHGNAIRHYPRKTPGSNQIRALLRDRAGNLWIGSNAGLARRSAASGRIEDFVIAGGAGDAILSLAADANGQLVFGSLKSGIGLAREEHGEVSARWLSLDQVSDANSAMVLSITEAEPGRWWAATYGGGIIEFDTAGHGRRITHRPAIATSLAHDRVAALWRDRSGLVWVSHERGVDSYNPANRTFDTILDGAGLQEISASAFMTDAAGRLWVALGDQGIDLIQPDGTREAGLRPAPLRPDTALPNSMIVAMAEAEPQEAWIGTLRGLYRTSAHGSRVRRVVLPHAETPRIGSIVRQGGILWLGTPGGLLRYDSQANTLQSYGAGAAADGGLSNSRITTILADPDGALWIGTPKGLNRFDPATGKAEQILTAGPTETALPQGFINALAFDTRGRLWVGTSSGGIGVLDGRNSDGSRRFLHVTVQAGLPSNIVNGLKADRRGRMWASTVAGVAVIDSSTLRAQALGRGDGLVFQAYYAGAVGQIGASDIVFGTSGGYAVVHPDRIGQWRYQPPLAISSLYLDHQARPAAPLLQTGGPGLNVPSGTRSVEIELAALDYSFSQHNRYAYRLEGYDKDWIETDANHRVLTYANVPPGTYRLHMRGSNRDGIWSPNELTMELHFLPAWYQTWWARLGAGAAVLALGWGLYRWRVRQLRYTQVVLQQQVYSRTLHLERLNAIVKSINEQLDFDTLLRTILRESSAIGQVSAAYALICEEDEQYLAVRASWQQSTQRLGQGTPLAEAQASLVDNADCIAPDIYLSKLGKVLAVRILDDQPGHGYLVFEQQVPFASEDLELFKALKEPFVSAFQKAHAISAIQRARAEAEASARAKSDFLANISHEIRTPMNAILGFADLGTRLELSTKPREYFDKIGRAGQNLLGIIDDVLDFSKIESGKLQLEAVPFSLADMLDQIADLFSWRAAEKGLELLVWASPEVPLRLVGDPLRLSQVLVNLVGNALKFTVLGHVVLRVELEGSLPQLGQQVQLRFAVEDSGVGISPEQQMRLFQAFSQADSSTTRLYGGTGLGLVISQQLVQAMGGEIEIESVAEQGSCFHFELALAWQEDPALVHAVPAAAQGHQVLVVDDSAPVRGMLEDQLRSLGCGVLSSPSGQAALEVLRHTPVDLVLLDWSMPDLEWLDVVRGIQAQQAEQAPPVILMMTEFAREAVMPVATQAGIVACLYKPFNLLQLAGAVLPVLGLEAVLPPTPERPRASASVAATRIRGARVLVVDDNVINQQVAREVLMQAGVQVEVASSGVEALHMIDHSDFDAVLMDIQMPGMDGYDATARIRAMPQRASVPVIAMTAHAGQGFRESSMSMGMNGYVTKPIEAERLFSALAEWIEPKADQIQIAEAITVMPIHPRGISLPGTDVSAVLERLGGNTQLLFALLEKFVEEFQASPQRLLDAIASERTEAAALLVHKVKGAAGNLSMRELHRIAGELEVLLTSSPVASDAAAVLEFGAQLEVVIDGIRALDTHKDSLAQATLA